MYQFVKFLIKIAIVLILGIVLLFYSMIKLDIRYPSDISKESIEAKYLLESSDFKKIRLVVEELRGKQVSDSRKASAQASAVYSPKEWPAK